MIERNRVEVTVHAKPEIHFGEKLFTHIGQCKHINRSREIQVTYSTYQKLMNYAEKRQNNSSRYKILEMSYAIFSGTLRIKERLYIF